MARKSKGRLYRRGKSETWYLEYFVNGKKIREALRDPDTLDPVTDKKIAETMRKHIIEPMRVNDQAAKLRAIVARAEHADKVADEVSDVSMGDAWDMFERRELTDTMPRTVTDYRQNWGKLEGFWDKGLRKFGPDDAFGFAEYLKGQNLSGSRFNKILNLCDRVFMCAMKSRPFQVVRRRDGRAVSRRELSESEIMAVIDGASDVHPVCGDELRVLLLIGIYTGLRLIDAALLNVSEIDFEGKRLLVTPRKTRRKGKQLVIPLHTTLVLALATCTPGPDGDVLPELARKYRLDAPMVTRLVDAAIEAQGITTRIDVGTARQRSVFGFHSLRHSFVTICAANGVPLPVVQELAGHGSPAIQRQYMHMGRKETQAAIDSLPNFGPVVKRVGDLCFTRTVVTGDTELDKGLT